jgi:hypothetical protein
MRIVMKCVVAHARASTRLNLATGPRQSEKAQAVRLQSMAGEICEFHAPEGGFRLGEFYEVEVRHVDGADDAGTGRDERSVPADAQ